MLEIIILSRVTHYVAALALFGMSIFPLYTYGKNRPRPHLVTIWWLALAALLGAVFWFGSVAFSMAGKLDSEAVSSVLSETSFGKVWIIRIILATIILFMATVNLNSRLARFGWLFPALCAASVASLAGVGHTQIYSGVTHIIHVGADGLHLLAAGAWLGGLLSLFSLVSLATRTLSPAQVAEASNAAVRFSGMGYVAVATLIGSGLINSWFLVGSPSNFRTPYGELLILKLVLFAGMLILAAVNRFMIVPKLIRGTGGLGSLRRHIIGEQALGLAIIFIVSVLGTMQPAVSA